MTASRTPAFPNSFDERVVLVSACSGHGFKHSADIGDAVAQLVTTGASDLDLEPFTLARFGH